jgi:hypothetical protein
MKNVLKIVLTLMLIICYSCKAQQLVQTKADVQKLNINEQEFINKPLKKLLNEIKPKIKTAYGNIGDPCYFSFRFVDSDEIQRRGLENPSVGLYVYVREPLKWNFDDREKGKEYEWTKEDVEKYGNLTVIRIKVIGNN